MNLDELKLNIPQLKQVVKNQIQYYNDFLSGEIRVVGLRDKVNNRLETLNKIQTLLIEHEDIKTYETTCAGCGADLNKDSLTEYCRNCM